MENNRENVGLLGSTRVGSRRVIQISAGFMIFFSMLGKYLSSHIFTYTSSLLNVIFKLISWFLQENSELCLHQFPSLCLLQYIAFCLVLLVSIMTSHFNTILWHFMSLLSAYDCWYIFVSSFGGAVISAIHKHELDEEPVYHWCCLLLGFVCSRVF